MPQLSSYKHVDAWLIKKFLDLIILNETKGTPLNGYEILSMISDDFNVWLSSGTIYSKLYSLENCKLIKVQLGHEVRYYTLTTRG